MLGICGRSSVPLVGVPLQAPFSMLLSQVPPSHQLFVFQNHVEMSYLLMSLYSFPLILSSLFFCCHFNGVSRGRRGGGGDENNNISNNK